MRKIYRHSIYFNTAVKSYGLEKKQFFSETDGDKIWVNTNEEGVPAIIWDIKLDSYYHISSLNRIDVYCWSFENDISTAFKIATVDCLVECMNLKKENITPEFEKFTTDYINS